MKKETALGIALRALGLAFSLGPLLLAFAMNDWDVERTLINPEEVQAIQGRLGGLLQQQDTGTFEIGAAVFDNAVGRLRLPVTLSLPFPFSVDLTEFELTLWFDSQPVSLAMEEDSVPLQPGRSVEIWLSGSVSENIAAQPTRVEGLLRLERAGVTMTFTIRQGGDTWGSGA
jgi:hypothetical protein